MEIKKELIVQYVCKRYQKCGGKKKLKKMVASISIAV